MCCVFVCVDEINAMLRLVLRLSAYQTLQQIKNIFPFFQSGVRSVWDDGQWQLQREQGPGAVQQDGRELRRPCQVRNTGLVSCQVMLDMLRNKLWNLFHFLLFTVRRSSLQSVPRMMTSSDCCRADHNGGWAEKIYFS